VHPIACCLYGTSRTGSNVFTRVALDAGQTSGKLPLRLDPYSILMKLMQTETNSALPIPANPVEDGQQDFDYPQREAAFFYGLFLRGHSAEELRRDIEIPQSVLLKWHREAEREPGLRDVFTRIVEFRHRVLAIFEFLIDTETRPQRVQ
jgi:hypothetical protein